MGRLEDKYEMRGKLGRLFGPIEDLLEHPDRYSSQEEAELIAKYAHDYRSLAIEFANFCQGQPGYNYQIQANKFGYAIESVISQLSYGGMTLRETVTKNLPAAKKAIEDVPIPSTSVILDAESPFSAYCKIKSLIEVDLDSDLILIDPYVSADIFIRYLQHVKKEVHITIVTNIPGARAGRSNINRWNEFLNISELFGAEYGTNRYRLLVAASQHDRWLVQDQKKIYLLGGSPKDAGRLDYYTISTVDPSQSNLNKIKKIISECDEWFGPATTAHRKS